MPQSTYQSDNGNDNDNELFFDHFTFEELKAPDEEELADDFVVQERESISDFEEHTGEDNYSPLQYSRKNEQQEPPHQTRISKPPVQPPLGLTQSRVMLLKSALLEMKEKIDKALELIEEESPTQTEENVSMEIGDITGAFNFTEKITHSHHSVVLQAGTAGKDRVLEGVFDGQYMAGSDGNRYAISTNYASKSKLVQGDALKLTIAKDGSFIYKQVGPVERTRVVGFLQCDREHNMYYVRKDNKRWSVLSASVTYFRGREGDETVVIVPRDRASTWGALENIIKKRI